MITPSTPTNSVCALSLELRLKLTRIPAALPMLFQQTGSSQLPGLGLATLLAGIFCLSKRAAPEKHASYGFNHSN